MTIAFVTKLLRKNLQLSTCLAQRSKRNGPEPNYVQFQKQKTSLLSSALVQSQSKGSELTEIWTHSWVSSGFWEDLLVKNRRSSGSSDMLLRGGSAHSPCVLQHGWVCSGRERDGSVHTVRAEEWQPVVFSTFHPLLLLLLLLSAQLAEHSATYCTGSDFTAFSLVLPNKTVRWTVCVDRSGPVELLWLSSIHSTV